MMRKTVQVGVLLSTALLGALAGFIPWLDRTMSGSRTVVFFPYFLAGLMCRADVSWEKYRKQGCAALAAAVVMIVAWEKEIPVQFLYHAEPYDFAEQDIGMVVPKGVRLEDMTEHLGELEEAEYLQERMTGIVKPEVVQRLRCYAISSLLCFFLLTAISRKRFPFTRAGADTMPAYLIHAPVVGVLREFSLPWGACLAGSALLLYIIYKIFQWRSPLYGIVTKERRNKRWPLFRKFMKNTGKVYTDSFWP